MRPGCRPEETRYLVGPGCRPEGERVWWGWVRSSVGLVKAIVLVPIK